MKAIKKVEKLIKDYGYRVHYRNLSSQVWGKCLNVEKLVVINKNIPKKSQIHALCHELGHIYCYENHIWDDYHRNNNTRTALRAEVFVDKWGKKKFNEIFPNGYFGKYDMSYAFNKASKDYLRRYYYGS